MIAMKAGEFTEDLFRHKLKRFAGTVGCKGVCLAFQLYYALKNPHLPPWAKARILGALAYFISFVDLIPDVLPGVGFTDDILVMLAAAGTVALYIDEDVKQKAQNQVQKFFKDCHCADPEKAEP
jgi:uncharacterized membrane protein YkvA (DUF1232 family)